MALQTRRYPNGVIPNTGIREQGSHDTAIVGIKLEIIMANSELKLKIMLAPRTKFKK